MIFCASHRVIFSLCESDIETYGFSDIIFALKTREANITLLEISRRCRGIPKKYHCEAIPLDAGEYK